VLSPEIRVAPKSAEVKELKEEKKRIDSDVTEITIRPLSTPSSSASGVASSSLPPVSTTSSTSSSSISSSTTTKATATAANSIPSDRKQQQLLIHEYHVSSFTQPLASAVSFQTFCPRCGLVADMEAKSLLEESAVSQIPTTHRKASSTASSYRLSFNSLDAQGRRRLCSVCFQLELQLQENLKTKVLFVCLSPINVVHHMPMSVSCRPLSLFPLKKFLTRMCFRSRFSRIFVATLLHRLELMLL